MKIKKVVIEGFRAYAKSGDGVFDFTLDNDKPANFVSIYAPNGFGKTSFYDAVEWALTDNIGRFVRDQTRQENDIISRSQSLDGKKTPILRNHSIGPQDPSYVEVVTDSFVERKDVPKTIRNRRDYVFKKEDAHRGKGISEIFLSQEAIDAFLREEKPDARYARFMASFSDPDETYRSNITVLKRELALILRDIEAKEDELDKILGAPPGAEVFEQINRTVASLKIKSENITQVGPDFDLDKERELRGLIIRRRHEHLSAIDQAKSAIIELNDGLARFTEIAAASKARAESKSKLEANLARRERFIVRGELNNRLKDLSASVASGQALVGQILSIIDRLPAYLDVLEKISQAESETDELRRKLAEVEARGQSFNQRIVDCKTAIEAIDRSVRDYVDLQRTAPLIFEQIATVTKEVTSKGDKEKVAKEMLRSLTQQIENNKEQIARVHEIEISESFLMVGNLSALAPYGFSAIPLTKAILDQREKGEKLNSARLALDRVRTQSSIISELLTLGAEIVATARHPECPLCSHNHSSFEVLLEKIRGNSSLSHLESDTIRAVEVAQQEFDEAGSNVATLMTEWRNVKYAAIESLRLLVNRDEVAVNEISVELVAMSRDIAELTGKVQELQSKVGAASESDLASRIAGELDKYAEQRRAQVDDIAACTTELANIELVAKDLRQSLELQAVQAAMLKHGQLLGEVTVFCLEHQVNPAEPKDQLVQILATQNERLREFKDEAAIAQQKLHSITLTDPSLADVQLQQIDSEIDSSKTEMLRADVILVPFFGVIRKHFPKFDEGDDIDALDDAMKHQIESLNVRADRATKVLEEYGLLNEQITEVMPYLKYLKAQADKDALLIEKFQYENVGAALDAEYRSVIARLQSRIDKFFYTELINSIYRKIDPHPDFKEVRFICDFSEGEKPKLHVLVSDSLGETIAPSLYFSAAQVNILSLSIFLARALHANSDGMPINCIFIDDPIHSMDSINVLSTIDLLRAISTKFDRQIVLSTHDKNFFELLQRKVPKEQYGSKFLELESFGRVRRAHS